MEQVYESLTVILIRQHETLHYRNSYLREDPTQSPRMDGNG